MAKDGADEAPRLDKWLWAARFFKTRSLATAAVGGGHVQVNGRRAKPGRSVTVGDQIEITKGQLSWTIRVRTLSSRRGPARAATELYEETEASRLAREQAVLARRADSHPVPAPPGSGRPGKRDRRKLVRLKHGDGWR